MPAQTALDLLTCRAAAATPAAVDSGDGTACGRDKEVSEFRMTLFIILLLPHQNLCIDLDHSAAEAHVLMVTDPILLHMHVIDGVTGGCGGGGGGSSRRPARRTGGCGGCWRSSPAATAPSTISSSKPSRPSSSSTSNNRYGKPKLARNWVA